MTQVCKSAGSEDSPRKGPLRALLPDAQEGPRAQLPWSTEILSPELLAAVQPSKGKKSEMAVYLPAPHAPVSFQRTR